MGIFDMGNEHINKSNTVIEHKFPNTKEGMRKAKIIQARIKHTYGFKPSIFRVTHPRTGRSYLLIAQAKGMKKIR